jgi:hypothetical protein
MSSRYLQEILPSKAKKDSLNNLSASQRARHPQRECVFYNYFGMNPSRDFYFFCSSSWIWGFFISSFIDCREIQRSNQGLILVFSCFEKLDRRSSYLSLVPLSLWYKKWSWLS